MVRRGLPTILAIGLLIALPGGAAADPGAGEDPDRIVDRGELINTSESRLPRPARANRGGAISPSSTTTTPLPGGVTAWSTAGLQWQESCCIRWVWGLTKSETSASIQEIEAHGALISETRSPPAPNCYGGTQHWTPQVIQVNTWIADSGWGPGGGVQHGRWDPRCYIMASGHYYIYGGVRTDVSGPDVRKDF